MKRFGRPGRLWSRFYAALCLCLLTLILLQTVWVRLDSPFRPDYAMEDLSSVLASPSYTEADYHLLFLQTGLSRCAVDRLMKDPVSGMEKIKAIQHAFFADVPVTCAPLFGFLVEEDRLSGAQAPEFADLQNGDVILTFSTHSVGWRHGHAGIVVDAARGISLEAIVVGTDSTLVDIEHWRNYSTYLVLRLKDSTPEFRQQIADYAASKVCGVPYHLTAGLFSSKIPDTTDGDFGVNCTYLVWYVFQHFGYDVNGGGGHMVTARDLACSPLFEIVQLYGLDPRQWDITP
ncbi:MAG: hypothetical protein LKK00_06315 [Intestinimonas sp.]|jgi:hypothetical protein|nr:hypothetical protein [Intestinimonas sp.]